MCHNGSDPIKLLLFKITMINRTVRIKKTSIAISILVQLLFLSVNTFPVSAQVAIQHSDLSAQIRQAASNTGDVVAIDSDSKSTDNLKVSNTNSASVDQKINALADTGNNEASRNISIGGNAGIINTGDAAVNVVGVVSANDSLTGASSNGTSGNSESFITNTGDSLRTDSDSNSQKTTIVQNTNTSIINQIANTSANTGNNVADRNISIGGSSGVITTGNASTSTNFLVAANGAVALVGGENDGNGPGSGASIVVANTGSRTNFGFGLDEKQLVEVDSTNYAQIDQSCGITNTSGCFANTGNNTSNRGIARGGDAGVITTSDATVNVGFNASANRSSVGVATAEDPNLSDLYLVNTGDKVNTHGDSQSIKSTIVNSQNIAEVDQSANASAITGSNTANRNIAIGGDAGIISTGNATVNVFAYATELNHILGTIVR